MYADALNQLFYLLLQVRDREVLLQQEERRKANNATETETRFRERTVRLTFLRTVSRKTIIMTICVARKHRNISSQGRCSKAKARVVARGN